jgi:RimJ/RimL family protein N-acetyltransferase
MLYGDCPLRLSQLDDYISKNNKDYKFVILLEKDAGIITIGFVHFYHNFDNQYTYVGGIHPDFFNSGLGASASVAALSLFYEINRQASFDTAIYKHNLRSLRLHLAIGFIITKETKDMYMLLLNKENFNNKFVLNIKKRIFYQLISTE